MRLTYQLQDHWPALAWLAKLSPRTSTITILHGPRVETKPDWFCEAAWAGKFADGDFDRTERVFGSGCRVRGDEVTFVSAASTLDRLIWVSDDSRSMVSNSLPCLMQALDASVDPTSRDYHDILGSICKGIEAYKREVPTTAGDIMLAYHHNLSWDGYRLREKRKPNTLPAFTSFAVYRDFMQSAIKALAENATDTNRQFPMGLLGTMSSGYDSACISTLAKNAGLKQVISIGKSKAWKSDSGDAVAKVLGLDLVLIERDAYRQLDRPEVNFVSSDAKGEDVYFSAAEHLLRGKLMFTGFTGDLNWDIEAHDRGPALFRGDRSGLSMSEYRLRAGYIHCPAPFLGYLQYEQIVAISKSDEMKPWDTGGDYTRPIPRRIIEEAGAPRGSFATEKKAASVMLAEKRDLLSPSSTRDFHSWLAEHAPKFWRKRQVPPLVKESAIAPVRWLASKGWAVFARTQKLPGPLKFIPALARKAGVWSGKERLNWYLFPWALDRAKQAYVQHGVASVVPAGKPQATTGVPAMSAAR